MEDARATVGAGDPSQALIELDPPYTNHAGTIQNVLLHDCGSVSVITSEAGAVRSNHYHKTDWHYLYVLSGEMHYQARAIGAAEYPTARVVRPGEMVFTPPLVEHRVTFPVKTVVLSMARLSRCHDVHEADVVRVA